MISCVMRTYTAANEFNILFNPKGRIEDASFTIEIAKLVKIQILSETANLLFSVLSSVLRNMLLKTIGPV